MPVGQRFPTQDMGISCLHCCEVDAPELGRTPGELNCIAKSDGPQEPARPAGPLTYPRWGSVVERRDLARSVPRRGLSVRCMLTWFHSLAEGA